ncbi:MAG: hypothetical protein KGM43_03990 [Planctomycetota bacterium]|nr:hypothetical protein [Planctomycetota bacterium]
MIRPETLKKFDKMLAQMDKRDRRLARRGGSFRPTLSIVLGLVTFDQLLARFVPMVWETALPGGLQQAWTLRGWPGLVWGLAVLRFRLFPVSLVAIAVAAMFVWVAARVPAFRMLVWLAGIAIVAADVAVVVIVMQTATRATMQAAGIPGF